MPFQCQFRLTIAFSLLLTALPTRAGTYTDTLGDNWGPAEVDLGSAVVSDDMQNLTFHLNLNPAADLTANYFPNYEVGIQVRKGAGGQSAINRTFGTSDPTAGNPYGTPVGISTGMNYFIGAFPDGPTYSGGAQLYHYAPSDGWTQVGSTAPITEVPNGNPSVEFSFPLSDVGLCPGMDFQFDVWSTFRGDNSAYDSLANPQKTFSGTDLLPYESNGNAAAPYDSAAAGRSLLDYRVSGKTPGDANRDGKIDFSDLLILAQNYDKIDVNNAQGDFNGDGRVDFADLLILAQNYGKDCTMMTAASTVPEPSSTAALGAAAAILISRRRR
jgi:hypothetical protein